MSVVGYLFNQHRIRVAPTLSDPQSLRLEPSMFITEQDIDHCLAALDDVCAKLRAHDAIGLTRYFIDGPERDTIRLASPPTRSSSFSTNRHTGSASSIRRR